MSTIPQSAGIYKVTCTANHKVYIGSTTEIRKRWYWHCGDLRRGVHHNRHLQFAWNKYGEQAFVFEILELVMFVEYLHDREQYWLDYYQAYDSAKGFNHGKVARAPWLGRTHSEETKQKLSELAKQRDNIGHARKYADVWHGSSAGREWHRKHGRAVWATQQPVTRTCQYCGSTFDTKTHRTNVKYCSNNCKSAARRESKADSEARTCPACGQSFICNKYLPTRCCSLVCAASLRVRDESGHFQ
jgi:group I intron endonuclease